MIQRILSSLGSGLTGNVSAQSLALLVQLVVALVTIPVFAQLWGLEAFGIWLILFTLPAYFSLVDLGFVGAAANEMTAAAARGDTGEASALYRELTGATFTLASAVMLLAGFALAYRPETLLDFAQEAAGGFAGLTIFALTAYAVFALCSRAFHAALRASGHFAKGSYCIALTALLDVTLAAGIAWSGGGLAGAALGYAMGQAIGLLAMLILSRHYAPEYTPSVVTTSLRHLRPLAAPAIALVTVTLGQAALLQGTVVVLGAAAGAAAVPAFSAMRTLARLGVQGVAVINQAVMPELTMARSRQDFAREADLVALNLLAALVIVVPAGITLALLGPWIVDIWSGGVIAADRSLALIMAGILVVGGLWGALASFLTSINQQARFAPMLLGFSLAGLAVSYPLSVKLGASGAAFAVLAVEIIMLGWTVRQAARAGFLNAKSVVAAPSRAEDIMRSWLGRD